jgi:multiple sugar transport system substrate-binding protein
MIGTGRYSLPGWSSSGFTSYKAVPSPKKHSHQTVIGAGGWGISPRAGDKKLCWQLIESIISTSTIHSLAQLGQQIPAIAAADVSTPDKARDEAQNFLNGLLHDCVPIAAPVFYTRLESVTMRHLQAIVTGQESPESGLAAADREIRSQL